MWAVGVHRLGAPASETFTVFAKEVGTRLRQALIASYGPDVGSEVTAEALAYAWEHWDRIKSMHNPAGYLYRVGQTKARRGIFRKPLNLAPPPINLDSAPWIEPALEGAIESLSPRQKAAVVLVHGFAWTVTEVAEMWGVSFSTVQSYLDRGLARLRKKLGVEVAD